MIVALLYGLAICTVLALLTRSPVMQKITMVAVMAGMLVLMFDHNARREATWALQRGAGQMLAMIPDLGR